MKTILRNGPGKVRLVDKDQYPLKHGEVRLQISEGKGACGVCGSDIPRYAATDALTDRKSWDEDPLGHEFTGTVVEVTDGVDSNWIGKRVTAAPLIPCHSCDVCATGDYCLCGKYSFIGSRQAGAFAEFVNVPAFNLVELPEGVSLMAGALIEPLAVVLHPLMKTKLWGVDGAPHAKIETALVSGMGNIGLLAVAALKKLGAKNIIATHTGDPRLETAKALGATHTVNIREEDPVKFAATLGGANVVFEASGSPEAIAQAYEVAAKKATVLWVGKPSKPFTTTPKQFEAVIRKELWAFGSFMSHGSPWPGHEWREGVKLLGEVPTELIIDKPVSFEEAPSVFESVVSGASKFIKVMVTH